MVQKELSLSNGQYDRRMPGKILFSLFNALSDIDEKISAERWRAIEHANRRTIQNCISIFNVSRGMVSRTAFHVTESINMWIRKALSDGKEITSADISEVVEDSLRSWMPPETDLEIIDYSDLTGEIYENVNEILNLPEKTIVLEILSIYFNKVFHSQINSLSEKGNQTATLTLEIKGKSERLNFENNTCKDYADEVNIMHKAIYIDNPFVVDELSTYSDLNPMNELLKELLTSKQQEGVLDGLIESIRTKEKLEDIYQTLQSVVGGEILTDSKNDDFYLKTNDSSPILLQNLSTGMKSFVILKILLEKGCIKEKDVIILDEPEIHLHPQWQIVYAELIVLLQKYFDLSVVVTTHSPYFVDAINLFSCKYGSDKGVNYYLSANKDNVVQMECVTKDIDLIYKKMASPIQMLETLRYELNNIER